MRQFADVKCRSRVCLWCSSLHSTLSPFCPHSPSSARPHTVRRNGNTTDDCCESYTSQLEVQGFIPGDVNRTLKYCPLPDPNVNVCFRCFESGKNFRNKKIFAMLSLPLWKQASFACKLLNAMSGHGGIPTDTEVPQDDCQALRRG